MPVMISQGKLSHRLRSWRALLRVVFTVAIRRKLGRSLCPAWTRDTEIGVLYWRGQFNHAFALPDIKEGRAYFDSLLTFTDEVFDVERRPTPPGAPRGLWHLPKIRQRDVTLLYLHGGGYAFHSDVSRRFADMLAHELGADLFAPDYRLTPEHPHPAQLKDGIAAYRHLLDQGVDPGRLVMIGDSAGGHLVLMLLIAAREAGLPQPALAIGLCPWTDIGARGESFYGNDCYDLVQGYMAKRFGEWLVGETWATREELSPIFQDLRGLAPLYLQCGEKEVLRDMIRDFADVARGQGADVLLDEWPNMTHNFQANGRTLPESAEALQRMAEEIDRRVT